MAGLGTTARRSRPITPAWENGLVRCRPLASGNGSAARLRSRPAAFWPAPGVPLPLLVASLLLFALSPAGFGKELSPPLREASELLRLGRLAEARTLAGSVQRAFPDNVEALLLLGRIEVAAGRLAEAKTWIRLAGSRSPRHPLVTRYMRLFEEWEHRHGPLSTEYLPLPTADPDLTAKRFKRGWFGPNFLYTAPRVGVASVPASAADLTPAGVAATWTTPRIRTPDDGAPGGLPMPGQGPDGRNPGGRTPDVFVKNTQVLEAEEALAQRQFLKAYLLFSRLLAGEPDRPLYLVGQARADLGMGRFRDARRLLDPFVAGERELEPPLTAEEIDDLYRQATAGPDLHRRLPPDREPSRR
ncbi:MAG: tetratricopeptide repeat protein [Candidatus Riflebacteria bacterium]|nr:tetratricopeptide repeat protein [Candidatus Riflebacteria bacterium]